jgi:hypothetical protein
MIDNYYAFVFKGLLTEDALDKAGRENKLIFPDHLNPELEKRLCLDVMDEDLVKRAKQMSLVFTAIHALENSVRDFVAKKLVEEKLADWWNTSVPEKIRNKAEARKGEEDKIKWHTQRGEALINFTDFGDLLSIIY